MWHFRRQIAALAAKIAIAGPFDEESFAAIVEDAHRLAGLEPADPWWRGITADEF